VASRHVRILADSAEHPGAEAGRAWPENGERRERHSRSRLRSAVVSKQQRSGRQRSGAAEPEGFDEPRSELERLRHRLAENEAELAAARADLAELGRAHEAQARHLVVERLSVAENAAALLAEIEELKADVEWRKGVMKVYEDELEIRRNSRSARYSDTIRRAARALRPRRT
jgi:hypothetical protein